MAPGVGIYTASFEDPNDSDAIHLGDGNSFVFRAQSPQAQGLYRWSETEGLSLLVDNSTPVPGFPGTFAGVGRIAVLDFGVAFSAGFSGGLCIFLVDQHGEIEPLILPGDTTVEGETLLAAFIPAGAGRLVAFGGATETTLPREAVFARTPDGSIHRIVTEGETFDGKPADRRGRGHLALDRGRTTPGAAPAAWGTLPARGSRFWIYSADACRDGLAVGRGLEQRLGEGHPAGTGLFGDVVAEQDGEALELPAQPSAVGVDGGHSRRKAVGHGVADELVEDRDTAVDCP